MKFPQSPSTETQNITSPSFKLNLIICRNFATFLSTLVALNASQTLLNFVVIVLAGSAIDIFRRRFAPEFKLSLEQRVSAIRESLLNKSVKKDFNKKIFRRTALIYWIWWSLCLFIVIPVFGTKGIDIHNKWLATIITYISFYLYPYVNSTNEFINVFGVLNGVKSGSAFLSITWLLMIAAAISELTGGAFYYTNKDISFVKRQILDGKPTLRRGITHALLAFLGLITLYSSPGIISWLTGIGTPTVNQVTSPNREINISSISEFLIVGVSLLATAGAIRALYLNFLYRISGGFEYFIDLDT